MCIRDSLAGDPLPVVMAAPPEQVTIPRRTGRFTGSPASIGASHPATGVPSQRTAPTTPSERPPRIGRHADGTDERRRGGLVTAARRRHGGHLLGSVSYTHLTLPTT